MSRVYFNPWLPNYKKPFGAIKSQKSMKISIQATGAIQEVLLVIRKENGLHGKEYYPMKQSETNPDFYEFRYRFLEGAGIYYYYFIIKETSQAGGFYHMYYGSNHGVGGEGRFYSNEHEVSEYSITCFEQAEKVPEWYREAIFYQIFPDRFNTHLHAVGTKSRRVLSPKENISIYGQTTDEPFYIKDDKGEIAKWDFYGGTLAGIIEKIPYLKNELGVNALYLNPIFEARSNHRYDTSDYFNIDPMLGDERVFKKLVKTLHENDMRIVLDGVFSHVGRNSRYFNWDGFYGSDVGATKVQDSPYYSWFKFKNWPNEYKSWWGIDDLPEIDKNNRSFQEYIYGDEESVLAKWNNFNIDGWRLDVVDELPDDFVKGIRKNLDTYPDKVLIGEVWEDASRKIAYGQRRNYILGGGMQSCMNYPFRDIILGYLRREMSAEQAAINLTVLQENYPRDVFYNNFNNVGTHDTERIMTMLDNNASRVNLSFGMMSMLPGVPCFYYGDEAGLTGGKDPSNRKYFPWGNENEKTMESMKKWIKVRTSNRSLKYGEFVPFYVGDLIGILRYLHNGYTIYVINPTDHKVTIKTDELNFTTYCPIPYDKLVDILDDIEVEAFDGYFISETMKVDY
ncbi:MAG: glycoside hydrolase family 13 protein [Streptococcaceae bacterium]|jgi:glycosidase|nr:glycoside hydrolase family 13 protein [Streptococcaceae bacterium]